ncbi:MAG: hypothetical protein ABI921_05045 [Panacibacter sp.]
MKTLLCSCLFAALAYFVFPLKINAQSPAGKRLFERDTVLEITLRSNIRELLNDRSETPQYHAINITCKNEDSSEMLLVAEAKTRGHFRKLSGNCLYPPLLLHFSKNDTLNASVFKEQDKVKLVMPCQGDEYIIREWLVYKLYNLVTPKSFRARLVKVKLDDTKNKKMPLPFYGILLEEEKQMANRNGLVAVTRKMKPEQAEPDAFLKMAVFEYLVGNTDWSVQYLQNIKLLAADSNAVAIAVPYDFDHAGIVNAPYAKPAEELELGSVRERRYRGYCIGDIKKFDEVVALYNELKKDIYSLYTDCSLLDDKYKKATLKYLDDFYATINNTVALKKEFGYPCNKNGTGNVVIKGLREE